MQWRFQIGCSSSSATSVPFVGPTFCEMLFDIQSWGSQHPPQWERCRNLGQRRNWGGRPRCTHPHCTPRELPWRHVLCNTWCSVGSTTTSACFSVLQPTFEHVRWGILHHLVVRNKKKPKHISTKHIKTRQTVTNTTLYLWSSTRLCQHAAKFWAKLGEGSDSAKNFVWQQAKINTLIQAGALRHTKYIT